MASKVWWLTKKFYFKWYRYHMNNYPATAAFDRILKSTFWGGLLDHLNNLPLADSYSESSSHWISVTVSKDGQLNTHCFIQPLAQKKPPQKKPIDWIKLFTVVGNIPYETTEEQLREIFSAAGPVVSFR